MVFFFFLTGMPQGRVVRTSAAGPEGSQLSPFAQYRVLDLKLHVDRHGTGVDARRVRLVARLHLGRRRVLDALGRQRRRRRRLGQGAFARQALVHFLHVVLQLVQTLAEELVGVLLLKASARVCQRSKWPRGAGA